MTRHLHRDLVEVHRNILALSAMVEEMIDKAALVLRHRRLDLVDEVLAEDNEVDEQEVAIEEECLKLLALHQPVAIDLRRIATVLKVNNDLERIADLAVNIAQRARSVCEVPAFAVPDGVERIAIEASRMVRAAMDAFVNLDAEAARDILSMDDCVDELNVEIIEELQRTMQQRVDQVIPALHCFSVTRHFERIADLATNIAEDVIYLVEGEIVRHHHGNARLTTSPPE